MDQAAVKQILPHRDPMLLISGVETLSPGASITAYFHADPQMEIFRGHFPGEPILPGVYSVECMAQAADLLLLSTRRYAGKLPLFLGIDRVRFHKKILPGDVLQIRAGIASESVERGIVTCSAQVRVRGEPAAAGEVTIALR